MEEMINEVKREGSRMVTLYIPLSKLDVIDYKAKKNNLSRNKYLLHIIEKHLIEDSQCKKTA